MLDANGGNWPIFKRKFEIYMKGLGLKAHFAEENCPAETYPEIEPKTEKKTGEPDNDLEK